MSKKIEMTPAQSESKEKLFAEAYEFYATQVFNINDFIRAVNYLRDDGLSFAHIAKISGMTHKSLMQFYYRDQVEPHARTKGKANFLIDFVSVIQQGELDTKKVYEERYNKRYNNDKS